MPPQSWEAEVEVGRDLGKWGKSRLTLFAHKITDIIDLIPVGTDEQGIGNLPHASRQGLKSVTTLLGDPIGWRGAKLDGTVELTRSRVRDPLTGESRLISGADRVEASLKLRHDIPRSKVAWGAEASYQRGAKRYFLNELSDGWEGPVFASLFVEHKNLFGLTARATAGNLLDARHRVERAIYSGRRNREPPLFTQSANQLIGPIFSFSVKGLF